MDPCCDPEVRHEGRCRPTMFTKQVSRPVDGLDPPIVAAEAEQVERTRRKTWSRAPIRGFCASQAQSTIRRSAPRCTTSPRSASRRELGAPRAGCTRKWNAKTVTKRANVMRTGKRLAPRRAAPHVQVLPTLLVRQGAGDTLAGESHELIDREEMQGDRPVTARGGEEPAVGTERHGIDGTIVAEQREHLPPGRKIPELGGPIEAGSGNERSVRAHGYAQ